MTVAASLNGASLGGLVDEDRGQLRWALNGHGDLSPSFLSPLLLLLSEQGCHSCSSGLLHKGTQGKSGLKSSFSSTR